MTESDLSKNKKILLTIRDLKARIKMLESNQSEPVAVIGMGCRFPGHVDSPDSYWQLLINGVDAISEVPPDRWDIEDYFDPTPGTEGKMYTRWGGFLDDIDQFDPQFFGISPREASSLDPQQRLLLEVSWEAMENAGLNPHQLAGSRTGVFIGITASDYAIQQLKSGDPTRIDAYFGTGNALNAAAGRLSYFFGFQGPSMIVDTACSSSLVSIHLACQSLKNGESNLALAGGVNLILSPETTITTSQAKMLSSTGRCKTFDESADGYVRGEGCGVIVLKKLSSAIRDNNTILGVIRGSAVNQDGQSAGFTVPNGLAQQSLISEALSRAGVEPGDIGYIEAHGTGTSLGDPIEIKALHEVLGKDRSDDKKLLVGSVKTNIGHLESASGIAGIIKTLLILQHKEIPAHLHLKKINHYIPIERMPISIPTERAPWISENSLRLAGVSSFGFSGTNAHIVLEEAAAPLNRHKEILLPYHLLTVSAKNENALKQLVISYNAHFNKTAERDLADYCYTSNKGRAHFQHRLAILGTSLPDLKEELEIFLAGEGKSKVFQSQPGTRQSLKTAFLFTGQGSQFPQMGKQLYSTQPTFRYWLDECERLLQPHLDKPLLSVIYGENTGFLDQTAYTQPALFALEYSLCQMWLSWGIVPDAVTGHSVGEFVAACIAGVYSLGDGLGLIAARGRLMQALPSGGEMLAVFTDEQQVREIAGPYAIDVDIASVNAPQNIVISGSSENLQIIQDKLDDLTVKTHKLTVSHAFHSPQMDSILEPFKKIAEEIEYHPPKIPLISNLTGEIVPSVDAEHWKQHLRRSVRFYDGMVTLEQNGFQRFLEIGPNPVLTGLGMQCLPESEAQWVVSLRRGREDWSQLLESLAALYVKGVNIDWSQFYKDFTGYRAVALPTYPFQRQRYWKSSPELWDRLKQAGDSYATKNLLQILPENHSEREKALDNLCLGYICNSLSVLGAFNRQNESMSLEELEQQFDIAPQFKQLLLRWLDVLSVKGILEKTGKTYKSSSALSPQPMEQLLDMASHLFPESQPLVSLVQRCGEGLDKILTGKLDPLELLFPGGSFAPLEALYQQTGFSTYFNGTIQAITSQLQTSLPPDVFLRILEIGAGTGSTTAAVLPTLPEQRSDYVFTDISEIFLQKARSKFRRYPFIRYKKLDIEQDIIDQGYSKHGYDLVIAANVLHATKNLEETMDQVKSLLAPGGVLVLWELTQPSVWFDITFGLVLQQLEDNRTELGSPFLSTEHWQRLLAKHDFGKVAVFPPTSSGSETVGQQIVLAQSAFDKTATNPAFKFRRKTTEQWLYKVNWEESQSQGEISQQDSSNQDKRWLIFADREGTAVDLVERLLQLGHSCFTVLPGKTFRKTAPDQYQLDPLNSQDFSQLLEVVTDNGQHPCHGIIHLWSLDINAADQLDGEALHRSQELLCGSVLHLMQALQKRALDDLPSLWLITRGAMTVAPGDGSTTWASSLWGMGKVIASENPGLSCKRVDLDPLKNQAGDQLFHELFNGNSTWEDQIAFRNNQRYVSRLVRYGSETNVHLTDNATMSGQGSYLVTGGLGGLGLLLAQWLAERGAGNIVLLGRNTPDKAAIKIIEKLQQKGVQLQIEQADVAKWDEIKRVVSAINQSDRPLKGVFHCAGQLDDAILLNQNWERFSKVLAPKVSGSWHLHQLTRHLQLDHFVLFSSASAILGTPGQSNHAAANAFMDALAYYRQSRELPAFSINWGAWSEIGAAARRDIDGSMQARGLGFIKPELGMETFGQILMSGLAQLAVAPISWPDFIKNYPEGKIPSLFQGFAGPKQQAYLPPGQPVKSDILLRLQQAPTDQKLPVLKRHLIQRLTEVLGWREGSSFSGNESFINLGLDSLMAVELKNIISQDLGKLSLPDTLLFDYPNIETLLDYLTNKLPGAKAAPEKEKVRVEEPVSLPEPVIIQQPVITGSPFNYPLTYAQKGMWFLFKMNPSMYAFNVTVGLRIHSDLDYAILKNTMLDLIARHPILRTRITEKDGEPSQEISESFELDIPVTDAADLSEAELKSLVTSNAQKPFDLEQGPLFRVDVFSRKEEAILLIVVHHIIFDGASTGILLDELTQFYSARATKKPIMLQKPVFTFADYVRKQNELLTTEKSRKLWDYWQQKLSGDLPDLDLPTDFPRPAIRTYQGASYSFTIEKKLTDQIYKFCREEDCTMNMFMVAAFQVLLSRYSGQDDILIGSPIAGRNLAGFEKVLGHFVNVVVLRADLSSNPRFNDFLQQVKLTVIEALQHQDYPFPLLVEKLNITRDLSRTPVFQAVLAFQSGSLGLYKGDEKADGNSRQLKGELYPLAHQEGESDLTLEIFERDRALTALMKYNPDLFENESIIRLTNSFNELLKSIISQKTQPVSMLNLLTNEERHLLLSGWQGKQVSFPLTKSIARLFEEQVEKSPGRLAIVHENEQYTYQELNDRANQLAHHLKGLNIEKQTIVGVYLDRSPELIISILAILKTSCIYLPLDVSHPEARTRYMLQDSGAKLVITQKGFKVGLKHAGFTDRIVDLSRAETWRGLTFNPEKFFKEGNLAYIIYTSGSTGKPKGVMVEHPGFVNMIYDQISGFDIKASDRCLQFASSTFDVSLFEIFMPLLSGAALVLASTETIKNGLMLTRYIEDKQVTVAVFTASYLRALDQHPLPTVETLIIGGEASDNDDVRFYTKRKNYFNAYGPTETSVCVAYHRCEPTGRIRSKIPIGKPISNCEIFILDKFLNPVPIGVYGEICIGGSGLSKGYLNQPLLTDQVFIPHPFKADEKIYKSGDFGRWLPEGTIEFVGRMDLQVKVRGFRIEIQEIENVLLAQPEIKNAVVLKQKQAAGEGQLVAFIEYRENTQNLTSDKLKKALAAFLPDYMIPASFHVLKQLPITSSGKIDLKALKPEIETETVSSPELPMTKTQLQLAEIWGEILGRSQIGLQDNFFDLGGDSLLAIQIVSRIFKVFNLELPVSVFFQNQTIKELAEYLTSDQVDLPQSALVSIQPKGNDIPIFCVHGAGGNVMCFKSLAEQIGPEREFIGIQSTQLPVGERSIPAIAESYLKEIRHRQENGPYIIAGWCMGGCIALEIAQRLRDLQQDVNLILIDSFLMRNRQIKLWLFWKKIRYGFRNPKKKSAEGSAIPGKSSLPKFGQTFRWNMFLSFVKGLALLNDKPFTIQKDKLKHLSLEDRFTLVSNELNRQNVFAFAIDRQRLLNEFREFEENNYALLTYTPKAYDGEVLLINAAETYNQKGIWTTPDHGFSTLSPQLKIKEVSGNHFSILNPPNVESVAKIINTRLKSISKPPGDTGKKINVNITNETIREIVSMASHAPTGDNCQPFRFAWDGKILAVSHLNQTARHHFNFHNVASTISLGLLIEAIKISAQSHQLDVNYTLDLSSDLGSKVCAEVEFTANPACSPDDLFPSLERRNTDRRRYKGGDIQTPMFERISANAALFEHSHLYFNPDFNKDILDLICDFETYLWSSREAHDDFIKWVRFSHQEAVETRNGMPWQSLGINYPESRVLKLTQNFGAQAVLNKLGGLSQVKNRVRKMIQSSATLGCLTVTSLNHENLTEAGRLLLRTWLALTKNGWGLQPYFMSSLASYSFLLDPEFKHFNPAFKNRFEEAKAILQNHFKIPENEAPCWVFRTGITTELPAAMKTLRYPIETILEVKQG